MDDRVPVQLLARRHLDVVGQDVHRGEHGQDGRDTAQQAGADDPPRLAAEDPQDHPAPGDGVDRAHHQRALQLPEGGQEQQREAQPADERADVVRGEQVRDGAARLLPPDPLEHRHQQRDLRADQQPHGERGDHHRGRVDPQPGERHVQQEHRQPAHEPQEQFDQGERPDRPPLERLGGEGPDPHREDHDGQDHGGLHHGVADEVAAQRGQRQLVDQAAGRADEDREEQQHPGPRRWRGRAGAGASGAAARGAAVVLTGVRRSRRRP